MKKAKKRIICLLMSSVMLLSSIMSGCGSETPASKNTGNGSSPTSGNEKLKPVTLRWILPKIQSMNDNSEVFDAANKIIKDKLNATVKFDMFEWGDFEKKISLIIESGEEADIFYTSNWVNNYYLNVSKGGLTDITDMLDKDAPNLKAKYNDKIWNALKINGKLYAVPNQGVFVRKLGFEFRKDLAKKYNFNYNSVKTLADLEPYLKTIKEKEPNYIPISDVKDSGGSGASLFANMKNYFGWDTFVSMQTPGVGKDYGDLKAFNQFESPEFKDYLKTVRDWYMKGYIQKDAATVGDNSANTKAGKYAVASEPAAYPGMDVVYSTSQAGGTPYVLDSNVNGDNALQTGSIASNLNGICSTSVDPDRALMLLDLVNRDKNLYNLLCWGQEGKNYTKQPDGTIEQIKNGKYEGVYNFFLGDTLQTFVTKGQPLDMYDQLKKLNNSGKPSVFLGFVFDTQPVKSQIAQCTAVTDQYLAGLCTGYLDPSKYYSVFIDKLKRAGSDQIITEMQKQLDKWSKTK